MRYSDSHFIFSLLKFLLLYTSINFNTSEGKEDAGFSLRKVITFYILI